jgi:tetratricopeptide (TPR) repeat protein
MARGAAQAGRKQRAQQPQPKKPANTWEDQLFFSRLRRHAKVVYVFLALVFAVGFVAFGVGSGSNGISGILQNLNIFSGSGGGSSVSSRIKDDQKKIAAHPSVAANYTDIATLYQQRNDPASAIAALERGAKANPKNLEILGALASVYRREAETARTAAQNAQAAVNSTFFTQPGLNTSSTFGSVFTSDPVSQALKTKASTSFSKLQSTYSKAESAYQRLAAASKGSASESAAQLQLASIALEALNYTGQPTEIQVAIDAYKRYLQLDPHGANAAQARQTIKQLQSFLPKSHG